MGFRMAEDQSKLERQGTNVELHLSMFFFFQVFPDLRAWCEARRLYLIDVDLRWVNQFFVSFGYSNNHDLPSSLV